MKIMFVQDKDVKKSSVVVNVGRGSMADPLEFQGLAHFLEHMLFMGSEKYPKADYYREFITTHGGDTNAWTDLTSTVFYHEVNKDKFLESLDILA